MFANNYVHAFLDDFVSEYVTMVTILVKKAWCVGVCIQDLLILHVQVVNGVWE